MPRAEQSGTAPATPLKPFRVHYDDGTSHIVAAATALDARKSALSRHAGIIRKVKIDRSPEHG